MIEEIERLPKINFPYLSGLLIELHGYQEESKPILIELVELERKYFYHKLKEKVKAVQSANRVEDFKKLEFFCIDLLENERSNYLKFISGVEPSIFLAPDVVIETINEFEKEKNIESEDFLRYMKNYMEENGILYKPITSLADIVSALKALKFCKNLKKLQLIKQLTALLEELMATPEKLDVLKDSILRLEKLRFICIHKQILIDITTLKALDALRDSLFEKEKRRLFEKTVLEIENGR